LGAYPSFTWRGIWNAHRLLEDGTGWRIENNELTNIWNNAWLPTPGDGKDVMIWRGDKSGEYIVQSGFKWLMTNTLHLQDYYTDQTNIKAYSTKLWNLTIPSKILLWRVSNNYLPTLSNLKTRRLKNDDACPICSMEEEIVNTFFEIANSQKRSYRRSGLTSST
ncbi:hypothetical protein Goshw_001354, partial [Gossypium schwendimanii]|nr:hypothetical protein [Gossypium schwendimanii]